jgi:hypothetical protein
MKGTIAASITAEILSMNHTPDMGDYGNQIGSAIAKFFSDKDGMQKEDFLRGIEHGISLVDGTHD